MNKFEIYLIKRNKIVLNGAATNNNEAQADNAYISTILKNLEAYGYTCSQKLIDLLKEQSNKFLVDWYKNFISEIKDLVGSKKNLCPMYPNFPTQVMEADKVELYINAIIHYLSLGTILPEYEVKERFPLIDNTSLKVIDLGNEEDFRNIFTSILASKSSSSKYDKTILEWFVENDKDVLELVPKNIPVKENLSFITALLFDKVEGADKVLFPLYKTATDVLRFAVALSKGDVSLSKKSDFISFPRKQRRLILSLLENCSNIEEDMCRYKGKWERLRRNIHPEQYKQFVKSSIAFTKIRNNEKIETFNGKLQKEFQNENTKALIKLLSQRPGEFARNLDRVLRNVKNMKECNEVLVAFDKVAPKVSTPILLQLIAHFKGRMCNKNELRTFFPKGTISKVYAIPYELEPITSNTCFKVIEICEQALIDILKQKEHLGRVYIDRNLEKFIVPSGLRSLDKALRTVARGSRFTINEKVKTIRAFLYWKQLSPNRYDKVDLDLSAVFYGENFSFKENLFYSNMVIDEWNCCHSGDITSAPYGATEYVDIDLVKLREHNIKYVGIVVNSFSNTPFYELPDCFVGYMERENSEVGEIFEPKTIKNTVDLTVECTSVMPMIIDVENGEIIWTELMLKDTDYCKNVVTTKASIYIAMKAMLNIEKPNIYDLAVLNARARGYIVSDKENADTIFSIDEGITPFETDIILSKYL